MGFVTVSLQDIVSRTTIRTQRAARFLPCERQYFLHRDDCQEGIDDLALERAYG
jgi:hypothetical protein